MNKIYYYVFDDDPVFKEIFYSPNNSKNIGIILRLYKDTNTIQYWKWSLMTKNLDYHEQIFCVEIK